MPAKIIEIYCAPGHEDTVQAIAQRFHALHFRRDATADGGEAAFRILARQEGQQQLVDQLQGALGKEPPWRIVISPVDATVPEFEEVKQKGRSSEQTTREELYAEIDRGARIGTTFLQLVVLSTIVAAIGLIENDLAIIIAAMLIAPLLGPNVAMAFGSALGDRELLARAAAANAAGIFLSVACAATVGLLFPVHDGIQLLARTRIGYDNIVLALASGAAGALSYTTKLPSALVGVMVAVALLPPAATLGYLLSAAQFQRAGAAGVLLAVNIVCVNLSAQVVFLSKGIKPRTWIERRAAKESSLISLAITCLLLAVLVAVIFWWQN